ncbi:MAG: cytochrome P450 [Acidimicrobiales bacterium]
MPSASTPPLDPLAPENRADPYTYYRWLRENEPVRHAVDGSWILTRYADGAALLRDPRFSTNPAWLRPGAVDGAERHPVRQVGTSLMMFLDPPDHTRLRSLVSKAFTLKVVEGMRAHVQQLVDELLDPVVEKGEMELVADLAHPLPVAVICELLGVPAFDRELFRRLTSQASRLLDGGALDPASEQMGIVAAMQLVQYFTDLVEERRPNAAEGDDLLSAMIAAEEEGDRLSHQELVTTATLLFVAGHETTSNLIGNAMLALLRNPDELARLRDDPGLIRTAVEEFLRYDSPVQFTARITTEPVEVGGQSLPAGEQVIVVVGAANRDPAQFPDPDRLDVGRADNRHLAFAGGPHFCLGASLARMEAQLAINTMLRRLPGLELVTTAPAYREHFVLRGVEELWLRFPT